MLVMLLFWLFDSAGLIRQRTTSLPQAQVEGENMTNNAAAPFTRCVDYL